jgi:hypothetical protein
MTDWFIIRDLNQAPVQYKSRALLLHQFSLDRGLDGPQKRYEYGTKANTPHLSGIEPLVF